MQHNLLINGKLVAGEGEKVPVYNPATGEVILEIAEATAAQVDAAVEAADRAFDAWSQTTPKDACGMSPEAGGRHLGAG
ncbi:gamma-aminobutyraldehyde dehydrogenase [Klebsiella pneumoniae]|uniref:Gamma-aminobutyraldehyde dehydrogenase n=1 Tax=Klebsiella pneumoniae TaxID=573 RepID=A0A378B5I2_KLEPN|nr:gamma-aminobutyraldehyde dehydrogenase [Klebsiella pneumoniae]